MRNFLIQTCLALLLLGGIFSCSDDDSGEGSQQVASPDWRKQVIYFIMTDRFCNGDTANDIQIPGGIERGNGKTEWGYNGGDLQGIIDKLDYIQGLGVTAVWITPPVLNQWWDGSIPYSGYHGYWASDFTKVDPHYGTLDKYKELARKRTPQHVPDPGHRPQPHRQLFLLHGAPREHAHQHPVHSGLSGGC